jgi:hypothetical protein
MIIRMDENKKKSHNSRSDNQIWKDKKKINLKQKYIKEKDPSQVWLTLQIYQIRYKIGV